MSTTTETGATPQPVAVDKEDPWRIGWRYVRREGPDGQVRMVQTPLRPEDLLHPQEEDFVVNNPVHDDVCTYLRNALFAHFAGRPGAVVLHDCRVDWGVPDVQPLGPDFTVLENVFAPWERSRGTFEVVPLGARLLLAVEVTSPTTRNVDLNDKVDLYFRAGVPFYAIVDPRPRPGGGQEIRFLGYRRDPANRQGYVSLRPEDGGRLWLETIRLWLASEGDAVVCYDENGRRLMDHVEAVQAALQAEARARAAVEARQAATVRAESAESRAQAETEARRAAEAQVMELEVEIRRLRGQTPGGPPNPAAP